MPNKSLYWPPGRSWYVACNAFGTTVMPYTVASELNRSVDQLADAMNRFISEPGQIPEMGRRSGQLGEDVYDVRRVNEVMLLEMELIT